MVTKLLRHGHKASHHCSKPKHFCLSVKATNLDLNGTNWDDFFVFAGNLLDRCEHSARNTNLDFHSAALLFNCFDRVLCSAKCSWSKRESVFEKQFTGALWLFFWYTSVLVWEDVWNRQENSKCCQFRITWHCSHIRTWKTKVRYCRGTSWES